MDEPPPRKRPRINRITRACAACRRRKIKCDGSSPCKACEANEIICSYDDDERRRNGPEYIQLLEKKVEELERLLGHSLESETQSRSSRQNSDQSTIRDHSTQPPAAQGIHGLILDSPVRPSPLSEFLDANPKNSPSEPRDVNPKSHPSESRAANPKSSSSESRDVNPKSSSSDPREGVSEDDVLETMVKSSDQPRSQGKERYWGQFAGLSLLQRMRKLCSSVAGMHQSHEGDFHEDDFVDSFDSACPPASAASWDAFALLPNQDRLMKCVNIALDNASCLLTFMNRGSLERIISHIYDTDELEYTPEDRRYLALLFAMLAVGRRFETDAYGSHVERARHNITRGLRYFNASRSMMDVADCHDVVSLQTVLFLVIFLQANSMISTAYSFICAAVAACLRMGLHSTASLEGLPSEQRRERRYIFAVLNIMDTYVTTALGLPRTLRDVATDSVVPMPDAPNHTTLDESALPEYKDPMLVATNAHAKLVNIMARAMDSNHPVTNHLCQSNGFYSVQYTRIVAMEQELEAWHAALPQSLDLDSEADPRNLRAQLLLRLAYANAQMVLYRPFLHHVAKTIRPYREVRYKAYACGSACVKAAMQVGWLAETLESHGLFNEANWFVSYSVSFAATVLMLFTLSNHDDDSIQAEKEAAQRLKDLLGRHADQNPAARRSSAFLQDLEDAKAAGRKHTYSEFSSHTYDAFPDNNKSPKDQSFNNPPLPQTNTERGGAQGDDVHDDDVNGKEEGKDVTMMLSEARGNYGEHGHELQAMSYPPISHHLDVKGPRGPPF